MMRRDRSAASAIPFAGPGGLKLNFFFLLCAWALVCVLLLGGGAANVYLTNALVQLFTLPTLIAALWRLAEERPQPTARLALYLIAAGLFIVMLELIPLPPSLWSGLPFRDKAVTALRALGEAGRWAPVSLTPEETIVSALNAIAPLSLFLGVISLDFRERRLLTLVALAFGFINAFVGLLQLSQGADSPLFFYRYSGRGDSVGLFSNRNHEAALLYSLTPVAAAWIGGLVPAISLRRRRAKFDTTVIIRLLAAAVTVFTLIVATLIARSRAGILLLMFALLGGLSLQPLRKFRDGKSRAGGVFAIVAILAMMLGLQYGLYKILLRLEEDPFADARVTIARVTAQAALKALPFGTGLGSFTPFYASIEKPTDLLPDVFVNAAHNDFLQVTLEAGAPGAALVLGFLIWFFARCREIWRREGAWRERGSRVDAIEPCDENPVDLLIARAATIAIALLLLHSLVDYPLRTNALMGLFAFYCALLVPPGDCSNGVHEGNISPSREGCSWTPDKISAAARSRQELGAVAEVNVTQITVMTPCNLSAFPANDQFDVARESPLLLAGMNTRSNKTIAVGRGTCSTVKRCSRGVSALLFLAAPRNRQAGATE